MTRHEAYVSKNWQNSGIANVTVARMDESGYGDAGVFLIDLHCLGVKDAFLLDDFSPDEFKDFIERSYPGDSAERMHPARAKKLIEGALAYAEKLGFAPARDYRKARRVLGGIDAGMCTDTFVYGCDGRPRYTQGPNDDETRVNRILAILDARLGPDGYDYILAEEEDEEDGEILSADDEKLLHDVLDGFLKKGGEDAPTRFWIAGNMTAMQICPDNLAFEDLPPLPVEFEDSKDPAGLDANFETVLRTYWNHLTDVLDIETAPLADDSKGYPFDFVSGDFEEFLDYMTALVEWANGFTAALDDFPDEWAEARARTDLAAHWATVNAWANPGGEGGIKAVSQKFASDKNALTRAIDLPAAVVALARALRQAATDKKDAASG